MEFFRFTMHLTDLIPKAVFFFCLKSIVLQLRRNCMGHEADFQLLIAVDFGFPRYFRSDTSLICWRSKPRAVFLHYVLHKFFKGILFSVISL